MPSRAPEVMYGAVDQLHGLLCSQVAAAAAGVNPEDTLLPSDSVPSGSSCIAGSPEVCATFQQAYVVACDLSYLCSCTRRAVPSPHVLSSLSCNLSWLLCC